MLHVLHATFSYQRVHGIDRPSVVVIHPGGKNGQSTQLPTVLVPHGVVWIVASRPPVTEWSHDSALNPSAGQRAVGAIRFLRQWLEHFIQCLFREGPFFALTVAPHDAAGNLEI